MTIFQKLSISTWQSLEQSPELRFLLSADAVSVIEDKVANLVASRQSAKSQQRKPYIVPSADKDCNCAIELLLKHCEQCDFSEICTLLESDYENILPLSAVDEKEDQAHNMKMTNYASNSMSVNPVYNNSTNTSSNSVTISDKWILDKKIGKGGFAWVHRAMPIQDTNGTKNSTATKSRGKYVALKFIRNSKGNSKNNKLLRQQVINEIKVYKSIGNHANIVKLYSYQMDAEYPKNVSKDLANIDEEAGDDAFETEQKLSDHVNAHGAEYIDCMILELEYCRFGSIVDGKLIDIIHSDNFSGDDEMILTTIRTYFHQLTSALQTRHNKGIIHRDLKLQNLLIDSKFQLKVADFGICKLLDIIDESNTNAINDKIRRVGTRGFMAPEIVLGRQYDKLCDIFSASVVLFYLLFGQKPFNNASIDDKQYTLIIQQKFDSFWKLYPKLISKTGKNLLEKMFEFSPLSRIKIFHIVRHDWYNEKHFNSSELYTEMKILYSNSHNKTKVQKQQQEMATKSNFSQVVTQNLDITLYPSEWHEQEIKYIEDPLIIVIGYGDYDSDIMPSLIGVKTDYKRVINAFYNTFGYSILYKCENKETKECETVYLTNDEKSKSKFTKKFTNYKLYWTYEEVNDFIIEAREQYFVVHKHDSLILIVSSHGEEEIMLTSDGDEVPHLMFLKAFNDKKHNGLFASLPKISILDMCRGSMSPVIPAMKIDNNIDNSIRTKGINTNKKSLQLSLADVILRGNNSNKRATTVTVTLGEGGGAPISQKLSLSFS